ncbi:hypothetical protein Dthio_PD1062 [Desulfonatronospira thiodismutans ASO3-1]|uniref:Uncharacterized protein n=1 Tax=Desulfonatronospira thiodismutans ASO3-1 TaxID=555779 RepID=D6SSQ7_9BACT|nr:hypothetical protein Dthio_PD1062 [Desulfonatronospira thiodismutans ASO3-1]RQD79334.1 MAG: hypothetical protein D5S03_00340 [Desulfonatronospira sp. MSAO_Bac3]
MPATQIRKEFLAHRSHRLTQIKEIEEACFFLAGIRTRKEKGISRLRGGGDHLSLVSKNETVPVPSAEPPSWLKFFLYFVTGFQE